MIARIAKLVWREYKLYTAATTLINFASSVIQGVSILAIVPLLQTWNDEAPSGGVIDRVFDSIFGWLGLDETVVNFLVFLTVLALLKSLLGLLSTVLLALIQVTTEVDRKRRLYDSLLSTELAYLYQRNFGRVANTLIHETRMLGMLVTYVSRFLTAVIGLAVYIVVAFFIFKILTLIFVAFAGVYYLAVRPIFLMGQQHGRQVTAINGTIQEMVNYSLSGYRVIKAFVREDIFRGRFAVTLASYRSAYVRMGWYEGALGSIFEPAILIVITLVYAFSSFESEAFVAFMVTMLRMYTSFQAVQSMHFKLAQHLPSLEVYEETHRGFLDHQCQNERQGRACDHLERGIAFRDVRFSYNTDADSFSLGPLNLDIPRGHTIGLVGRSGSGKSTCVDLLQGFLRPAHGRIEVDGEDLGSLSLASFRRRIGYVSQDMFFINDTIHNNIVLGDDTLSEDDVRAACRLAHAAEFIEPLPSGYQTPLGEHGTRLSGGQKQRIALARALAHKPEILILDEATSALDAVSEREVQEAIDSLSGSLTIILIAHRLSTVRNADNIYVYEDGKIVEQGTFEALLAQKGRFFEMHSMTEGVPSLVKS